MCKCRTRRETICTLQGCRGFLLFVLLLLCWFFFSYVSPVSICPSFADLKWCKRVYLGLCFHLSQLEHLMSLLLGRRWCVVCFFLFLFLPNVRFLKASFFVCLFFLMTRGRYTLTRISMWICWAVFGGIKSTNCLFWWETGIFFTWYPFGHIDRYIEKYIDIYRSIAAQPSSLCHSQHVFCPDVQIFVSEAHGILSLAIGAKQ